MNKDVMYDEVYLPLGRWIELGQYMNDNSSWPNDNKFNPRLVHEIVVGQGIEFEINGHFYQGPTKYYSKE